MTGDKVKFIFEMPRKQARGFVDEVWKSEHFAVKLSVEEIEEMIKMIKNIKKKEVILKYGK